MIYINPQTDATVEVKKKFSLPNFNAVYYIDEHGVEHLATEADFFQTYSLPKPKVYDYQIVIIENGEADIAAKRYTEEELQTLDATFYVIRETKKLRI